MPAVDTLLAWAVPVEVEVLGAHLEAYLNMSPTINTLRLCHRFGAGPKAAITRLPPELLCTIEGHLVAAERSKLCEEWVANFKCFQLKCRPLDHVDEDWVRETLNTAREHGWINISEERQAREEDDLVEDILMDSGDGRWTDHHRDQQCQWETRVGSCCDSQRGWLGQQKSALHKYFGLETWISHVRLNTEAENGWFEEDPVRTTVAYLKMPGSYEFGHETESCISEKESGEYCIESGFGIPAPMPKKPTATSAKRFKRALDILGLKPRIHHSQKAAVGSTEKYMGVEVKESYEPQLTILVKMTASSSD